MKNLNNKVYESIKIISVAAFLSILVCQRYLNNIMIYAHDLGYHLNRIMQISDAINGGRFPILIHSGLLHNLGYANPLFYPELFLYIPAILISITHIHALTAYKLFLIIISFFTFLSMYYASNKIFEKKEIAYLSGILYTFSLYRLTDIYVRGALGELIAFIFLPLLIYGLYNVLFEKSDKWFFICIGFWGLINSHVLSFIIMIPIVLTICILNVDIIVKNKKIFFKLLIAACISVLLCIGFIGPMIEQKSLGIYKVDVHDADTPQALYERANSLSMTLSSSVKSGFSVDSSARDDGMSSGIGLILIILALGIFYRKNPNGNNRFETQGVAIGMVVFLMTTKLFPWNHLGGLSLIQFPYRLNIIPTVLFSLIGANIVYELLEDRKNACAMLSIIIVIFSGYMISNININFNPEKATCFEDLVSISKGADREVGNAEYIPTTANENSDDLTLYNIHEKNVSIPFTQNGSNIEFEYNGNDNEFEVNIPLIYYKGYDAKIKDNSGNITKLDVLHNTENGHVLIKGDKSLTGTVEIKYKMTLIQKVCYTISSITIVVLAGFIAYKRIKKYD
ncbi:MAG: YfhO family protein [Clostridia bacterium]|nr:YfhO family protein [Clostridia bacterium]